MPGLRLLIVRVFSAFAVSPCFITGAGAQPAAGVGMQASPSLEAPAAVTLDRLSVRVLRADRPWDPRVCTGCDLNNGRPPARHVSGRLR